MLIQNGTYGSRIKANVPQSEPTPPDKGTSTPPKTGVAGTSDSFENQKQVANVYDKPTPKPIPEPPSDAGATVNNSDLTQYFGEFDKTSVAPSASELKSILNDPSLPMEEKMALFLFSFLETAGKDLLSQLEQLDRSRQKSTGAANSKQSTSGQGGVNGNQGTEGAAGSGNVQNVESEQVALEKLKLAHEKMNKMFSTVDNILTSNTRTVTQGPIAALKG